MNISQNGSRNKVDNKQIKSQIQCSIGVKISLKKKNKKQNEIMSKKHPYMIKETPKIPTHWNFGKSRINTCSKDNEKNTFNAK